MKADRQLHERLQALSNGTLSESEARLLDEQLATDAGARQEYIDWMATEAALNRCCSDVISSNETRESSRSKSATEAGPPKRIRAVSAMVLAASLIGVALVSSLATLWWVSQGPNRQLAEFSTLPGEVPLARITSTVNCRWKQPVRGTGFGTELRAGDQLNLEAGLAEVTFDTGVRIILEGPATLDLRDATEAVLLDGRLAARIPASAQQPRLRVERCVAFEPGSEFGLQADRSGVGEVHVFRGRVSATLVNELGETLETIRLSSFEGARVAPEARTMTRVVADGDRFVRSLSPTSGPHDGLYLQESFDYLDGPLALQNGGFGWAGPWEDIEAAADQSSSEATNRVGRKSLSVDGIMSVGGRAQQVAQGNRVRRAVSTSIGGVFDAAGLVENRDGHRLIGRNGRTVYVGFLQRIDRPDDGFYGFELHRGDGNSNRVLCIGNGAEGAAYGVTSNYNHYVSENYPSLGMEDVETNLFVIRVDFGTEDRDVATVYRNPRSLTDEADCTASAKLTGNFAFDRISLGNFDGTKVHEIDEIRVGTDFRAVTGQRDLFRNDLARRIAVIDVFEPSWTRLARRNLSWPMLVGVRP